MKKALNTICLSIATALFFCLPASGKNFNYAWFMSLKKDRRDTFMRQPLFITFSQDGNRAYVVDGTGKLFSYTMDRGVPKAAFFASGMLNKPIAMAKLSATRIAVVNRGTNEIDIIDLKTRKIEKVKMKIIPDKMFYSNGNFYILDRLSGDIIKINGKFEVEQIFKHGAKDGFIDFKIKNNNIIGLLPLSRAVKIFNIDTGKLKRTIKLDNKKLVLPISIDTDADGYIYICDKDAGNIKIYNDEGKLMDIILNRGEKRGELYYPSYITFDKQGKLWVAEEGNGRVEVFDRQNAKDKK
ncbi:hypothetical protein [Desulfurobacterium sp.]